MRHRHERFTSERDYFVATRIIQRNAFSASSHGCGEIHRAEIARLEWSRECEEKPWLNVFRKVLPRQDEFAQELATGLISHSRAKGERNGERRVCPLSGVDEDA